jgi:hypothetical protein
MSTFRLLAASSIIFAMGCAQTPADESAAVANADGVICAQDANLGSRLNHRKCTTKAEREEVARITREEITNRQRAGQAIDTAPMASPGN